MRHKVVSAVLRKSPRARKKWRATVTRDDGAQKTVDFGAAGAEDYTSHRDAQRMHAYLIRHGARAGTQSTSSRTEKWGDAFTAGFWSRWLLWSKPSLTEAAREIERRHKIKIRFEPGSRR